MMLRERWSMIAAAALLLLVAATTSAIGAEPAAEASSKDKTLEIVYVGDIMLDDLPGKFIEAGGDPFADFAEVFAAADLVVGNLECVVGTKGAPEDKPWTFQADPRVVPLVVKHFDAVSLANNHTGDYGKEAFVETLELLQGKIGTFGGGRNLDAARTPLIVEKKGRRIALLGYNEFKPRSFAADATTPGCAWAVDEQVLEDIRLAREKHKADIVLPYMHWGHEGEPDPSERQVGFSKLMLAAGASAVIGAHPHCTQGTAEHEGKPIIYSLGNFVFDGFDKPETLTGWLLRLRFDDKGVASWDTLVARLDDQGIPHLDRTAKSPRSDPRE